MVESLGDKLRQAREDKGCTCEYVSRETNIARRYLEALEAEDFEKFPGEPYLLGFLRNYGDYLGLNVKELLALYRAIKIQEQPVPVEQLLHSPSSFPKVLAAALIVLPLLALIAATGYFVFLRPRARAKAPEPIRLPVEYVVEDGTLERRFYRGDSVLVPLAGERFRFELRELGDPLTLAAPQGSMELALGADTEADVNGDGFPDVVVSLSDYDRDSPSSGARIRFSTNLVPAVPSLPGGAPEQAAIQNNTVLFTSSTAYPFTVQAQFQGYCMFRWEADRRDRTERYFSRNDEIYMQAQNGLRVWASNAAAIKLLVTGAGRTIPLEMGTAGEVVVADVRWLRDDNGRFRLVHYRLD